MQDLDELFVTETAHEKCQKKQGFVADFQEMLPLHFEDTPKLPSGLFFKNKDIFMSKHSRYAPYPEHTHQFLELNYMYKGSCHQVINGKSYTLVEGDILLMNAKSRHSIAELKEKDILINILFQNKDISIQWLNQLQGKNSLLYQFLLANSPNHQKEGNFVIMSTSETSQARDILKQMMNEYFLQREFSQEMIRQYLPILFYELARNLPKLEKRLLDQEYSPYLEILRIIDREYTTISLHELADRLNFNKNYLSNLIKSKSGQTFTELITQRKLIKAQLLLQNTRIPINEIAQSVGFSNKTYFYKKYKTSFGHGPKEERDL